MEGVGRKGYARCLRWHECCDSEVIGGESELEVNWIDVSFYSLMIVPALWLGLAVWASGLCRWRHS